jgi:tRNA (mo5U34)-methyltransferase
VHESQKCARFPGLESALVLPSTSMSTAPPLCATLAPLRNFREELDAGFIAREARFALRQIVRSQHWSVVRELLRTAAETTQTPGTTNLSADGVTISTNNRLSHDLLNRVVDALIPWRIGPFEVNGHTIDSEWRSFLKWSKIQPLIHIKPGSRIADVGCSNGYFLFKLLQHAPSLAVGFDPVARCWLQFAFLHSLTRFSNLAFVPAGLSLLTAFPSFFDLIICMGVIYHQRDPFQAVRALYNSTRPGGRLLLESLVIDREGSYLLVPNDRYAKMRNAWIIPTADALAALMARAGFREIEIHRFGPITTEEQRRTAHAPYESLADFLDPADPSRTIEGHPAPHSAVVMGLRI